MKTLFSYGLILAVGMASSGCAPDRDLDDYKRDKVAQDLARMEPVVGTFSGELVDSDGHSMGPLVLSFDRDTTVVTNPTTTRNERVATLVGAMNVYGPRRGTLELYNGYYDDKRGEFQASASVKVKGTQPMVVRGRVDGDVLTGTVTPTGFTRTPARFTLRRGASGVDAQLQAPGGNTGAISWRDETFSHVYEGKGRFKTDGGKYKDVPVRLTVTDAVTDTTDLFYTALLQKRPVTVVVTRLDIDVHYSFATSEYDAPLGTIVGSAAWAGGSGNVGDPIQGILKCQALTAGPPAQRWGCRMESTGGGKFADLEVGAVE